MTCSRLHGNASYCPCICSLLIARMNCLMEEVYIIPLLSRFITNAHSSLLLLRFQIFVLNWNLKISRN
eukprot:c53483_g1_i1 orf=1-201(-)